MAFRNITDREGRLLRVLAAAVPELGLDAEWPHDLLVEPMDDGGMGSLRLSGRKGVSLRIAAELKFTDVDGVPVLASLYVDDDGTPLELDMWKVDFNSLIEIPVDLPAAKRYSYEDGPR
jgi:hypothetical protein